MRVALALGAGGARGYAHMGVIEVLEEQGLEIVSVAGSSMGAVIGGLYAAGKLDDYAEWVRTIGQLDLLRMLDPTLNAPGAMRADKVLARVSDLLDGARIEQLPIPFTAVATDLLARREVWFQQGPVDVAIRASIALPAIITPVVLNGRLLADGGLMDPLPIAPTTSTQADATIAVSLSGARGTLQRDQPPARESADPTPVREWRDRFRHRAAHLLDRDVVRLLMARFPAGHDDGTIDEHFDVVEADGLGELPPGLRKLDMMNLALDAMQDVVTRYRLASYPPDLLIEVPKDACRTYEFHRAAEMIELGRRITVKALHHRGLGR